MEHDRNKPRGNIKVKCRRSFHNKVKRLRGCKGNTRITKKVSKEMDGSTTVPKRGRKEAKVKDKGAYARARSCPLHPGKRTWKRRKKRVRGKERKEQSKTIWKGKKQWMRRKKRRVWDGRLHTGSLNMLEKFESKRREERRVRCKERNESDIRSFRIQECDSGKSLIQVSFSPVRSILNLLRTYCAACILHWSRI